MNRLSIGIVGISALLMAAPLTAANAADMAVKAPPAVVPSPALNWAGFYVGIAGGGGWGRTSQTDTSGVTSGPYNQSGALVGGTVGYNYQINNLVVGLEADISWANINGTGGNPLTCTGGGGTTCFTNMNWLNTDRARLGVIFGQFLPYITGGAASAGIKSGQDSCAAVGVGAICGTNTEWGWTFGGGIEAMIAPSWSAKAEYLYTDFGSQHGYTVAIPVNITERVNVLRVGLNYHFH
jgi:outer membrane immunogenic protein